MSKPARYPTPAEPGGQMPKHSADKRAGYNAAVRGEPRSSCPIKGLCGRRTLWLAGWWQANEGKAWRERQGSYASDRRKERKETPST